MIGIIPPILLIFRRCFAVFSVLSQESESGTERQGVGCATVQNGRQKSGRRRSKLVLAVVHGASANLTEQLRSAMIVTYYPDGTKCGEFQNPSHEGDAKGFLGGVQPGDLCDNDATNPVVWRAGPSL